jgi:transposase
MRDYTGKIVFIGIDVHKKTYSVTCICEQIIVKRDTLKASPACLMEYLNKYFSNAKIKTVYEAGFSGFVLHRNLLDQGIDSIVVHAASVEISARDRVKTDKRDSLKLATQLSDGRLKGIHVPTPQREAYREVSRTRAKIAKDKRRVGHRIKSLLFRQGLIAPEDADTVNKKWFEKITQYKYDESIKYCVQICIDEWLFLSKKLKEMDNELAKQALADKELERIYQSVPGIGVIHARVLANELEDMKHFTNEKQLFSFTGLTPSEYSSGEHKRQGHISRQGRSVLRKTLIQAAWKAIYKDNSLEISFERMARNVGKKRAITGIARRLVGQMRSCLKSNELYRFREPQVVDPKTGEISLTTNSKVLI